MWEYQHLEFKHPKTNEAPAPKPAETTTPLEAKPVKLRVNWWGADERHQATQKAMELYTQLNPHVTFDVDFSDHGGHWQKMATMSAANNAPDIFQMDLHIGEYAGRNQLADLSSVNTADIDEALLDTGKVHGLQLGIPLGSNATGLVYNKAALEKLGVPLPKTVGLGMNMLLMVKRLRRRLVKINMCFSMQLTI